MPVDTVKNAQFAETRDTLLTKIQAKINRDNNVALVKATLVKNEKRYPYSRWLYSNKDTFVNVAKRLETDGDDKTIAVIMRLLRSLYRELSESVMDNPNDIKGYIEDLECVAKAVMRKYS